MMNKEQKFEQIYEQSKDKIYRLCLGFMGNKTDADDLFQEVLIKIWSNLDSFRNESNIDTWIYRITTNTALLTLNRKTKLNKREIVYQPNIPHFEMVNSNSTEKEQEVKKLYKAVSLLKEINWQNLWKVEKSTPLDIRKLITTLNKIKKKGNLERIIILITIPITIVLLATFLPLFSNTNYLISIALISVGMLIILIQSYRSKYNFIINDAELNNQTYIKNLIHKLKQRMLTTSRYMWIYAFFLILGLNIGYIEILQNFNVTLILRIIIHIIFTGVMFYLMYYFIEKRKKENDKEILPLVDFLENLN